MGIQISPEIATRLAAEARKNGLSVEALLERFLQQGREGGKASGQPHPELPVWHLGEIGSLHRRDIYDDVP
jgi:hypothetical protein